MLMMRKKIDKQIKRKAVLCKEQPNYIVKPLNHMDGNLEAWDRIPTTINYYRILIHFVNSLQKGVLNEKTNNIRLAH